MARWTQKQEVFCLKYVELGNISKAALIAGYSPKTAPYIGSENLNKPKIIERIAYLRQVAEDATIATVLERKQVLTEIVRGRFANFMTNLTAEKLRSAALQEIRVVEIGLNSKEDDEGKKRAPVKTTTKTTTIKLHSPIQAIAELNKMEGIYEAEGSMAIDNRTLIINVISDKAKELTQRVMEGERTSGDNGHQNL